MELGLVWFLFTTWWNFKTQILDKCIYILDSKRRFYFWTFNNYCRLVSNWDGDIASKWLCLCTVDLLFLQSISDICRWWLYEYDVLAISGTFPQIFTIRICEQVKVFVSVWCQNVWTAWVRITIFSIQTYLRNILAQFEYQNQGVRVIFNLLMTKQVQLVSNKVKTKVSLCPGHIKVK